MAKRRQVKSSPAMPRTDNDYRIREAADTIMKASELRQDKPLMKSVDRELNRRERAIKSARKGK